MMDPFVTSHHSPLAGDPSRHRHGRRSRRFLLEFLPMIIPPPDLSHLKEACRSAADTLREALEEQLDEVPETEANSPDILAEAFQQLMDTLRTLEFANGDLGRGQADHQGQIRHLSNLGDHGMQLLMELAAWARRLGLAQTQRLLEGLTLPLALWIARHGGELSRLEVVVSALAALTNQSRAPAEMEDLYLAASEIMDAVASPIALDLDRANLGRPWRILVLNRAIIATRSHQPALMEQAFQNLEELLPEDAPGFFREGMEQMESLDYPDPVRTLMNRYYQLWCAPKTLH